MQAITKKFTQRMIHVLVAECSAMCSPIRDIAKLREFAATLCARHCVARQGSQQWCDTKICEKLGPLQNRKTPPQAK